MMNADNNTDLIAIKALLTSNADINHNVWEPLGHTDLLDALVKTGFRVKFPNLLDIEDNTRDFLHSDYLFGGDVITIPSSTNYTEIIEQGLKLIPNGHKVFVLLDPAPLKISFFLSEQLRRIWLSDSLELKKTWFEFERGYIGDSIVKWMD